MGETTFVINKSASVPSCSRICNEHRVASLVATDTLRSHAFKQKNFELFGNRQLPHVRQLVHAMGGQISVCSKLGTGTRFDVALRLPLAMEVPLPPAPLNLPIAYYEPHAPSAQALAALLQRLGCHGEQVRGRDELRQWLGTQSRQARSPWLLVASDGPLAAALLESAQNDFDPGRVIGMSRSDWVEGDAANDALRLPRTVMKPVLRAALVSRLGTVRRAGSAEPVTTSAWLTCDEAVSTRGGDLRGHVTEAAMHVLVVEDDVLNQTIVCRLLRHGGYSSTAANNGAQALALLAEHAYDLVLMDWQMPDMDGLEVTRRMRAGEAGPWGVNIPIVALTANAFAEDRAACLDAGMNDFLSKPVLADRLMAAVKRWTDGQRESAHASLWADIGGGLAQAWTQPAIYDPSVLSALPMVADGSEPEYAEELMAMFLQSTDQMLRDIADAMAAHDIGQLLRLVHTLKSSSAMVGALELASLAGWHESQLRREVPPPPELPQLMLQAVKRLQHHLHQPSVDGFSKMGQA